MTSLKPRNVKTNYENCRWLGAMAALAIAALGINSPVLAQCEPPDCDDTLTCTDDTCNEETDSCVHTPNDNFCPDCDDCVYCTDDTCNTDSCVHTPNDEICVDLDACFVGFCDPETGCFHTAVVCTPMATQGAIANCYPDTASANQAALDATTDLSGTGCSTDVTKFVLTGAGSCDTSIVVRVSDDCENYTDYTYNTTVGDTEDPIITLLCANPMTVYLNSGAFIDPGATAMDNCAGSFAATASGTVNTGVIGTYTLTYNATDPCGNLADSVTRTVYVKYASNSGILQPINLDGSSVCKRKSTVPVKFKVFDANGISIGTPGVVTSFVIVSAVGGDGSINEAVDSTTPDTEFRWDPVGQLWIFNLGTSNLYVDTKYTYAITLNDASVISFSFTVK